MGVFPQLLSALPHSGSYHPTTHCKQEHHDSRSALRLRIHRKSRRFLLFNALKGLWFLSVYGHAIAYTNVDRPNRFLSMRKPRFFLVASARTASEQPESDSESQMDEVKCRMMQDSLEAKMMMLSLTGTDLGCVSSRVFHIPTFSAHDPCQNGLCTICWLRQPFHLLMSVQTPCPCIILNRLTEPNPHGNLCEN